MLSRSEAKARLEAMGAEVTSAVSAKTTMLIAGHDRGEKKYKDALAKGVPIIPWEMFVFLGFTEPHEPWENNLWIPHDLYRSLIFTMAITLDNLYAYILSNDSATWTDWAAFRAGAISLDQLLSAAWRPTQGEDYKGSPDNPRSSNEIIQSGIYYWRLAVHYLTFTKGETNGSEE
jgi:hypothetical protein